MPRMRATMIEREPGQADQRGEAEAAEQVGPPSQPAKTDLAWAKAAAPQQVYAEGSPREQLEHDGEVQPEVDQVER